MGLGDAITVFSEAQAITVSTASNYAGTGAGSFAAGVLDTGGEDSLSEAVKKFPLVVSVGVPFAGPLGATLTVALQESNDGTTWTASELNNGLAQTLTQLQMAGFLILKGPLPISGNGPTGKLGRFLRVFFTVTGGPFTAGTINAKLDTY